MTNQQRVGAVIAAAGSSRRMDGVDKILAPLGGKPILARVIDAFEGCGEVDRIVIVASEQNLKQCQQLVKEHDWPRVAGVWPGGERRQDSVMVGLGHLDNCHWVVIHDGARPLVTADLISHGLAAATETGAATSAVPVTDTIKLAGDDHIIRETLPRHKLWAVQTPQVFRLDIIAGAYHQEAEAEVTDDASLAERAGYRVKLYMGAYENIKITTPQDLALAEVLLRKRGN
ncbi:MAG: 2-C-methyl-D-erythritol 4-phosphate cytidylyltransferase [Chloroflexota bacterium]|nr:2-C-methyl-D-erythritol 4-phosphate cytidylyltransferase [Chloroflexota bacterium]